MRGAKQTVQTHLHTHTTSISVDGCAVRAGFELIHNCAALTSSITQLAAIDAMYKQEYCSQKVHEMKCSDSPLGACSSPLACQRCAAALSGTAQLQRPTVRATALPLGSDCQSCHLPYHTLLLHCLLCCCYSTAVFSLSALLLRRCSAAEGSLHSVAVQCSNISDSTVSSGTLERAEPDALFLEATSQVRTTLTWQKTSATNTVLYETCLTCSSIIT
jgi:hypothetical protein